jgi:hypothetical protein
MVEIIWIYLINWIPPMPLDSNRNVPNPQTRPLSIFAYYMAKYAMHYALYIHTTDLNTIYFC